ncbi:MAG TPA: 5-(carboxyamino)imidazole ribonucleotide synthase, partial [Verrucomicrobiota bacterium]|nr:5-(carboxyamino)imidazole ribonucleotide synthase [Verrucomicrobiota bacterium]
MSLGIETAIFERQPDSPAARLTHHHFAGDWHDEALLAAFATVCDVVTLENEFVDAGVLRWLETRGLPVYPSSSTLAAVQDKLIQKETMRAAGLPL